MSIWVKVQTQSIQIQSKRSIRIPSKKPTAEYRPLY